MIWTSLIAQGKRRLWMSLFVATLVSLVYLHFARFYQGRVSSWILAAGWVPVTLNLVRAGLGLAYRLDRHPFRILDLGLDEDQVAPGRAVRIEIRSEARRSVVLRKLSVELRCTRQKSTERGKQTSVLHTEEKTLALQMLLNAASTSTFRAALDVPAGAPYSFRSMESKILWAVHVLVEIEGWGELRDELEITVAPG